MTSLKEEKGKCERETKRQMLKGCFPSYIPCRAQSSPLALHTPCSYSSPDTSQKLGTRGCTSPGCRNEKEILPSLAHKSQKRSPWQRFASHFPRSWGNCHTGTSENIQRKLVNWKEEEATLSGRQKKGAGELYPETVPQFETNISFQSEVSESAGFGLGFRQCLDQECTAWM